MLLSQLHLNMWHSWQHYQSHTSFIAHLQLQVNALPTAILVSPDNKYAFIVLRGFDEVLQYTFNSIQGDLDANASPYLSLVNGTAPYDMIFVDETHAALTCVGTSAIVILTLDPSTGVLSIGASYNTGAQPYSAAVGDFNGDGFPDVAAAGYGDNSLTVLYGNGTADFIAMRL